MRKLAEKSAAMGQTAHTLRQASQGSPDQLVLGAKRLFIKEPANMKLLVVVDKLLTGFDARHAPTSI